MSTTIRKQKSGDQLSVGDWLAPGELIGGAAEVLFTYVYPARADRSRDNDGHHVQLVLREQGKVETYADIVSGTTLFEMASDEDLSEYREAAERAAKIADIRALANFLERNPWVPMPYAVRGQATVERNSAAGVRRVRELADRLKTKVNDSLDDRTCFDVEFGRGAEITVIAWHDGGRPAEPAPIAEHYDASDPDADVEECACGATFGLPADLQDHIAEAS